MHIRRPGKKRLFCKAQLDRSPSEDEELAKPKLKMKINNGLKRHKTSIYAQLSTVGSLKESKRLPARLMLKKLNTIAISSNNRLEFKDVLRGPFKTSSAIF